MESLNAFENNSLVAYAKMTSEELHNLELPTLKKIRNFSEKNPSLSLHISMVFGFAKHLPYSMDIKQEEYVPGDFLNLEPYDVDENSWFKYNDRRTIYNAMVHWGDTFKSGVLLQVCFIFQQMLLGNIPADFKIGEEDYELLGINKLTNNVYNRNFFEILSMLPAFYQNVISTSNNDERRKKLDEMYAQVRDKIENRVGGYCKRDSEGNVIEQHEARFQCEAYKDIDMFAYFNYITYFDGLNLDITRIIKEEQLKKAKQKSFD